MYSIWGWLRSYIVAENPGVSLVGHEGGLMDKESKVHGMQRSRAWCGTPS